MAPEEEEEEEEEDGGIPMENAMRKTTTKMKLPNLILP
jgi:hypothetical protein